MPNFRVLNEGPPLVPVDDIEIVEIKKEGGK